MFWQESTPDKLPAVPDDVVDLAFAISCRALPVDHAWALSQAIVAILPWFANEDGAGLHPLHVADSGNGWMRPEGADDLLCLSRRTRLVLRVPRARSEDAKLLSGAKLDVQGHAMQVGEAQLRLLSKETTLFSRYIVLTDADQDENAFLADTVRQLGAIGVRPKKMLCGLARQLRTAGAPINTRSLMIAELSLEESFALQRRGLGPLRTLGCGLFIPHKGIGSLHNAE